MKDKQKRILIIILFYAGIFGIFLLIKNQKTNINLNNQMALTQTLDTIEEDDNQEVESKDIFIHISGEIHYPGLVKLTQGQRLYEAIEIAGGMTEKADIDQINLSLVLNDEDKIYIPQKGETSDFLTTNKTSLININTSSKEELMTLSGIGEKTAESIIEFRTKERFKKIEDLKKINGIGEQKFNNIKDQITIWEVYECLTKNYLLTHTNCLWN